MQADSLSAEPPREAIGSSPVETEVGLCVSTPLIAGCRQSLEGDALDEAVSDARVVPRGTCCQRLKFFTAEEGKLLTQRKLDKCILIARVIYDVLFNKKNKFQRHVCSIILFSENKHLCYFCKFLVCLNLERKLSSL